MRVAGDCCRTARMQSTKWPAPPSRRSSRSTLVITTWARRRRATVSARFRGSCGSGAAGRPCATSQNGQRRVHRSPSTMNVAVPLPKHSPMFGHEASSHTVCRPCSRSVCLTALKVSLCDTRTRIQLGLTKAGASATLIGMWRVFAMPRCAASTPPATPAEKGGASACTGFSPSPMARSAGLHRRPLPPAPSC